jgi:hypothetical protein
MIRTTLSKVDKADTSLVEAPTVLTLAVQLGSKASDDTPFNNDPNLLNFATVVSWIACWTSYQLQRCCPDLGKPDGPIFTLPDTDPAFHVLSNEDVKSGLWVRLRLAPLIFLPLVSFWTFGLEHPRLSFLSYDNLFRFG